MLIPLLIALPASNPCLARVPEVESRPTYLLTVAASRNGSGIAIGTSGGSVWIVDTLGCSAEKVLVVPNGGFDSMCFSPDGERLAARITPHHGIPNASSRWVVADRENNWNAIPICVEHPTSGWLPDLGFRPDGLRFFVSGNGGEVNLVDSTTGMPVLTLDEPDSTTACWWGDHRLVTGNSRGRINVWDADTGDLLLSPIATSSRIDCVLVSPDGARILTTSFGPSCSIWNGTSFALEATHRSKTPMLAFGEDRFLTAAWSEDGERILLASCTWYSIDSCDRKGGLLWSHDLDGGAAMPMPCSFDPSGGFSSCARNGGTQGGIYDARSGDEILDGALAAGHWDVIEWTGDGKSVALLNRSAGTITVAEVPTFTTRFTMLLDDHSEMVLLRSE